MLSPVFLTSAGSAFPSGRATRTPVSFSSSIEYGNTMHMHRHPLTHNNESTTRGRLALTSHYPGTRAPPSRSSPPPHHPATLAPLSRSVRGGCFLNKNTVFFLKKSSVLPVTDLQCVVGIRCLQNVVGIRCLHCVVGIRCPKCVVGLRCLQCVVGMSHACCLPNRSKYS